MPTFRFRQVDVFTGIALKGNPLAVVLGGDGISDRQMAAFANWTNLSETTFLLRPTAAEADYRVRIFTPERELPFAGHPTLGSCHAWLQAGNEPKAGLIVQECAAGLIRIRRDGDCLAFAAPPLKRKGAVDGETLAKIAAGLRLAPDEIVASNWCDNGPGWVAVMLRSRAEVLALRPDYAKLSGLSLGVVGKWTENDGGEAQFEVRAFISSRSTEDPVTGSLNAGLAQWLIEAGIAPDSYVASQGTALGRDGRVRVDRVGAHIWVGGQSVTCIEGQLTL